jgi:hypothetical protein
VDAKHIGAVSRVSKQAFGNLQISSADPDRDVALLDSPEFDSTHPPALEVIGLSELADTAPLKLMGYPYGIDLIPTFNLLLRNRNLVELRSLLDTDAAGPVLDRGSPLYRAKVLSIQGKFLPGDSGAPVLDSKNRVFAIANGGLKGGLADISWAIPLDSVSWEDNPDASIARLRGLNPAAVFFFAGSQRKGEPSPPPQMTIEQGLRALSDEASEGFLKYRGAFWKIEKRSASTKHIYYDGRLVFGGANYAYCEKSDSESDISAYSYYSYTITFADATLAAYRALEEKISAYLSDFKEDVDEGEIRWTQRKNKTSVILSKEAHLGTYDIYIEVKTFEGNW